MARRRRRSRRSKKLMWRRILVAVIALLLLAAVITGVIFLLRAIFNDDEEPAQPEQAGQVSPGEEEKPGFLERLFGGKDKDNGEEQADKPGFFDRIFGEEEPEASPTPSVTPAPTPTPLPEFNPASIPGTQPADFGLETRVEANGTEMDYTAYTAAQTIDFGEGKDYTGVEGVITFRGNNFRDSAAYGTVDLNQPGAAAPWTFQVGSLAKVSGSGSWTGCGWTGQPLIVKWPDSTKRIMNMYDSAKNNPDLVEVIYATMDGNIYFLNLHTGEKTRDPIKTGFPFKGAGALDPRGYPLMYVGSGDDGPQHGKQSARAFIISLIDGKILHEFGVKDGFAQRELSYFDSSALVDAETDTLIYPGENGILYLIRLNSQYDEAAGAISINPETVKWRFKGAKHLSTDTADGSEGWWLGIEDSAITWRGHIIFTDNGGHMICLDLNTLQVKWVQNTLDDTNCTGVFSLEGPNHHPYVYTSTSFHPGWRAKEDRTASIPIWKIDAMTGQIAAQNNDYNCQTIGSPNQVSGGVQGSLVIGRGDLEGLVFAPIAMTDGSRGELVAFNTSDMSVRWRCHFAGYPWSSPVAVYDAGGKGYLIQCNKSGYIHLIDGQTGEIINEMSLGSNIEASPAIYNNWVVVGTRGGLIYGMDLNYLKNYVKPAAPEPAEE